MKYPTYKTLQVIQVDPHIIECRMSRPDKLNAVNLDSWREFREFFAAVADDNTCRVVLLTGEGRMFTSGLDFSAMAGFGGGPSDAGERDVAHQGVLVRKVGTGWQDSFSNIEKCGKVVIACVHNACLGAGIEMIAAADIRMCTQDSYFKLLEIDIGMAADVGGLQRFPKIIGNQSLVRELVFSGRRMDADEALKHGFVSRVCESKEKLREDALKLAKDIAAKSPVALYGAKHLLNYSRDHSVNESLDYALTWNMSMIQAKDMERAVMAVMTKQKPEFPNLPDTKHKSNL